MLNHPTHQIKINLPQPGESKSQFMTRSVRLLLKSGKSKEDAIKIAEKIWNNVSQHVSIQPNQTDANVVFSGNTSSSQPGIGGSVSVRQTDSFNQLKSKLNKAELERQSQNQTQFLQNLQTVLVKTLSPLATLGQQLGNTNNIRNYNNINNSNNEFSSPGISPGNIQGVLRQSLRLQSQMLQSLNSINHLLKTSVEELTTIRSTGLKVRRAKAKAQQPIYSDYWKSDTAEIRLNGKYGNFLETFISNIAGEMPGLAKGLTFARNIINPVQYVRKKISTSVRNKIDTFRKYTGDLNYKYSDDRAQLKKDAGLLVLDTEQLNNQVITKIVPEKLGEIIDADKEKIDILRNIYRVNAQMANYLTKGQVSTRFQNTINKERTVFDSDVGQYFTQTEHDNFTKSRINQIRRYLTNVKRNIQQDPIQKFFASANKSLNKFSKRTFGTTGVLSEEEILNAILAGYNPDTNQYSLAHREQQYADSLYNILNKNERRSARRFGPQAFGGSTFGKVIDFMHSTVLDEFKNGPIQAIVGTAEDGSPIIKEVKISDLTNSMKYMTRKNGTYITDKIGNPKLRWARHSRVGDDLFLDLRSNAKLSSDDLIYSDGKESTYNPFLIGKDLFKEFKNALSSITDVIHENINEESSRPLKFLKWITPKIKPSEESIFTAPTLNLDPLNKTKSRFSTNSKNLISTGIENGTNIPDLKNSIDDYKTFVINDIEHPLYVIEVSGKLSDKSIPGISNSNSIYAALPGVLAAAPTSPQSPNGANTSVTKELEQENAERKQDKRDSVQEDLNENIEKLNELIENGGLTATKQTNTEQDFSKDTIFKSLIGGTLSILGKGALGILGALGITKLISTLATGVTGLIKGSLGLLFKLIKGSFGSILEGFGKGLLGKAGLIGAGWMLTDTLNDKLFGVEGKKEDQTTSDWQNENAAGLAGMGVTSTGLISGGQYLKNKLGPTEDIKLNDNFRENLKVARDAKGADLTALEKSKIAKDTLKQGAKTVGKNIIKGVAKKLPVIGFLMSTYSALERFKAGDYSGAIAEVGSGLLATLPGIGTVASLGIDAGLAVRDSLASENNPTQIKQPNADNLKNNNQQNPDNLKNNNQQNPEIQKINKSPSQLVIEQPDLNKPGNYITVKVSASQWENGYREWISKFGEPTNRYKDGSVSYVIPQQMAGSIPNVNQHINAPHVPHNPTLADLQNYNQNDNSTNNYQKSLSSNSYGYSPTGQNINNALYTPGAEQRIQDYVNGQTAKFHSGGLIEGNPGSEQAIIAKPGEYVLNQNEVKSMSKYLSEINDSIHKIQVTNAYTFEKIDKPLSKTFIKELEEKGGLGEVLNESFYDPPEKNGLFDFFKSNNTGPTASGSNGSNNIGAAGIPDSVFNNLGPMVTQNSISGAMAERELALGRKNVTDLTPKNFKIGDKRIGAIEASILNTEFYNPQRYNTVYPGKVMTHEQVARRYGLTEEDLKKDNAYTLYYDKVGGVDNAANIQQTNVFKKMTGQTGYTFQPTRGNSIPQLFNEIIGNGPVPTGNDQLGSYLAKYESGKKGSSAIGYDRKGGTSYGKYQIASNTGTYAAFLKYLKNSGGAEGAAFAAQLQSAGPGNTGSRQGAAPEVWKQFAQQNPELLGKWEHDFIKKTHYDVSYNSIKKENPELAKAIDGNRGLQEMLWSTSVQHGGGKGSTIFNSAWGKSNGNVEDFIKNVYAKRGTQFGSSETDVQNSVQNRFVNEANDVMALYRSSLNGGETANPTGIENVHSKLQATQAAIEEASKQNQEMQQAATQSSSKATVVSTANNPKATQSEPGASPNNIFMNGAFSTPSSPTGSGGAVAQQAGIRTLDGPTQNIINSIFDNTSTNFSHGATNYAIGNNPMSVTHI